ncbi:MAG: hypothetical protein ACLQQ4_03690 [Bacteroidia bacterium]
MKLIKKYGLKITDSFVLFLFLCIFQGASCFAQSSTVSPYSSYGLGDLQNQNGVQSFSMGGTGIALHNDTAAPYFINLKNPASYFYNRITTYEAGLLNNNIQLSTEGTTHNNSNAYFGYFAIAFPVSKHFGGSFGLRPMSSVGYSINTTGNIDSLEPNGNVTSVGTTTNQYIGSGGINQVHLGLAYSPFKGLSIGANGSFLFGYLNYQENVVYPLNISAYNSQENENVNVHGFTYDFGMMYTLPEMGRWQAVVGGTFAVGNNIFGDYNLLSVNYIAASPQTNIDTVQDSSASGKIKLPMSYGVGLTIIKRDKYNNDQFIITADYAVQNWSQCTFLGQAENLNNSTQKNIGIQYIPQKNSTFFSRIHYRAGFSINQTYLNIDNTPIYDYCASLGVAIPVGPPIAVYNQLGILNIGIQAGQLGTTNNNLLQERYVKFLVAFTFDSRWFIKRLYQ